MAQSGTALNRVPLFLLYGRDWLKAWRYKTRTLFPSNVDSSNENFPDTFFFIFEIQLDSII
jgi:hypothetical protein